MSDKALRTAGETPDRLIEIDALRGFALFGVFGANLPLFSGLAYLAEPPTDPGSLETALAFARLWWVENKFMGLFSMLFGYSFWLFLRGLRARGAVGTAPFYRRVGWLFLFGALHGWVFWCWDILRFYALWALLLPWCAKLSPRRLFLASWWVTLGVPAAVAAGGVLFAGAPGPTGVETSDAVGVAIDGALAAFSRGTFVEALQANWRLDWAITLGWSQLAYQSTIFGHFLMGLAAARYCGDAGPAAQPRVLARVWWWSAPLGLSMAYVGAAGWFQGSGTEGLIAAFQAAHRAMVAELGNASLSLAWAAGFLWLVTRPALRRWLLCLAPVGRMALSLYLLQSVLGLLMFYRWTGGPAWMGQWTEARIAGWWFAGFALQIWLANLWLRHHAQGPMEWLWRSLTWWRWQPWQREAREKA